jgi:hypothetical protein
MQMKIGRWEGLYPQIQSAAKHIRCGLPVCSGRNGERSLVPLSRVYTVLTQARTGPPRRCESNESMKYHCRKRALPNGQYLRRRGKRVLSNRQILRSQAGIH